MAKILKKDFVKTGVFALIVSIVLLLAVFEIKKFQDEEELVEIKDRVVRVAPSTVNRIQVQGHTLIRDVEQGVWRTVSPINDYLNFRAVEDWLAKALSFDGRNLSDGDEKVRWVDFGFLENSPKIIYFSKKDAYAVSISEKTAFDGSVYLKFQKNKETPLLLSSNPEWSSTFAKKVQELRSLKVFDWTVSDSSSEARVLKVSQKNKEVLSLFKEGEAWKSARKEKWTISKVKVEAFLSDLKQYLHKGFADSKMRLEKSLVTVYVGDQKKNGFSVNIYKKKKKVYAVVSFRPEHVLKLDDEALDDFAPEAIEFREFTDLVKGFEVEGVVALKIRKNNENKVFRMKEGLWTKTDGKKIPAGFEFNSSKVSKVLETFKSVQYKRYVKEKDVLFKSAKKKLYFYKDQKTIDMTYSVGQAYPCSTSSKKIDKCLLVATNKVQGYYGVALKDEVNSIFKFGFVKKIEKEKDDLKTSKGGEQ